MPGFCWLFVFSCLLLGLTVGNENTAREKVYYKQSLPTAANETQPDFKQVRMTMEGQPQSVNPNTGKVNSKVKKESRTVPRKGVIDKSVEGLIQNDTMIDPSLMQTLQKSKGSNATEPNKQSTTNPATIVNVNKTTSLHVAPVKEELQETLEVVTVRTTRKPKPKPTLTIGGQEADDPIPASPTDKSTIIMPTKIDYIVPVAITFTALPLLGVAFYVLYKHGKDYWSKRHYRRMDFLIDGMYNE